MTKITKLDAEIILAYAEYDMNALEVARQIYVHPNTVDYHLNKVKRVTGLNPYRFYDLHELVGIAEKVLEEFNNASSN